jgi:predicted Zn-dependent protease
LHLRGLFFACLLAAAAPAAADFSEHAKPDFYEIEDPVERALAWAADGQTGRARSALEKACTASPNDAEAWAALAVVYGELKASGAVKRCERKVMAVDRAQGKAVLAAKRASFKELKSQIWAEKEAKGENPLPVERLQPTPDAGLWERLDRERSKQKVHSSK